MPLELVFISLKTSKGNDTNRDTEKGSGVSRIEHLTCSHLPLQACQRWMCDHEGLRQKEKVATFSLSVFPGSIHIVN